MEKCQVLWKCIMEWHRREPCGRICYLFAKTQILLFLLGMQLGYISQSPLQVGRAIWLIPRQWNVRCDMCQFQVWPQISHMCSVLIIPADREGNNQSHLKAMCWRCWRPHQSLSLNYPALDCYTSETHTSTLSEPFLCCNLLVTAAGFPQTNAGNYLV